MKFNTSNAEVYYIANILRETYIPTIRIIESVDDALRNENFICNNTFYTKDTFGKCQEGSRYFFGKRYLNLSSNFISKTSYYDSDMHEALGRYLRAYRDTYKINLMDMYNCFSNRSISNFSLPFSVDQQTGTIKTASYNKVYKLYAFPICFDVKYTIKLYGHIVPCTTQAAFFNKKSIISVTDGTQTSINFPVNTVMSGNQFSIKISTENFNETKKRLAYSNEKYLYLFLQVPSNYENAIVVLEESKYAFAYNKTLLNLTTKSQIPYSDKLLEYLTGNAITPVDGIHENIDRIQQIVASEDFKERYGRKYTISTRGLFDENLFSFLRTCFKDSNIPDFLGYVDKDVEDLILKVQSYGNTI